MRVILICTSGTSKGKEFAFVDKEISIGRTTACQVQLNDGAVSRIHCEIFKLNDVFYIRDRGSINGTLVNGTLITSATILQRGDTLKLGKAGPEFSININHLDKR